MTPRLRARARRAAQQHAAEHEDQSQQGEVDRNVQQPAVCAQRAPHAAIGAQVVKEPGPREAEALELAEKVLGRLALAVGLCGGGGIGSVRVGHFLGEERYVRHTMGGDVLLWSDMGMKILECGG